MSQKTYIARKGEDLDVAALTCDSLVVNTTTIDAGAVVLADDEKITLGTSSDVTIEWDTAANPDQIQVMPAADDSVWSFGAAAATQKSFDVRFFGQAANGADYMWWDASASSLFFAGDARIDFTGATTLAANTDGGIIKGGTSIAPITEDTANMKFISFYFDDGATSGTAQGIYDRLYVTGAGGSGQALRAYTTVLNVAATDARGAHISLDFGATGTVTGSGQAATLTLHIADQATQGGTLSALTTEIYADGDTSDPSGAVLACWRASNGGGNGSADIDDDCALFYVDSGFTEADGNMIAVKAAGAAPNVTESIRIRLPAGVRYLYAGTAPLTA